MAYKPVIKQERAGAHTGDVSAEMLADVGASYVLVGHSERRTDHGETDALVAAKSQAAYNAGLIAVICIGETLDQREDGSTLAVIDAQLAASSMATCPVKLKNKTLMRWSCARVWRHALRTAMSFRCFMVGPSKAAMP